ncbi:PLC-like phosphodiesterase [Lasiosphaeria ovina]|uniref:Phosphoinositide phospholipase C n=1 Tax=Lasiosphaeria ovina TaxID=92902 RepID=A0AAE0KA99_9PEZI|nr:PLC-like phosphodiesterase [Lasiosphaeria ovina]
MSDAHISAHLARLSLKNVFSRQRQRGDDDDEADNAGEKVDAGTVAGGGHSTRPTDITAHKLRVSEALRAFLAEQGAVADGDEAALHALVEKLHVAVPAHVTDRSHPLPEYFISSSHNTYLLAHQLFGASSAGAYEATLAAGARCVEIDAWDNPDDPAEPKVTHGWTLVSHISFRAVCETIRDVVDRESAAPTSDQGYAAAPILLSLENHCAPDGQRRLATIMREVWGDRLLGGAVAVEGQSEADAAAHVRLQDLGSKIVVIVEYHLPNEARDSDDSSSSSSEDEDEDGDNLKQIPSAASGNPEEEEQARQTYKAQKKAVPAATIIPELAELGVYAQSVKPSDDSWYAGAQQLRNGPHHHLINVSEAGLAAHVARGSTSAAAIARHNASHLMRVFPKGTRISSRNLRPLAFWALGAQVAALNWQTFGASMQLNEALFAGTAGYVLKPAALRAGGSGVVGSGRRNQRLRLHVVGATDVPVREAGDEDSAVRPYVTCSLLWPSGSEGAAGVVVEKRKTGPYRQHKTLTFLPGRGGEAKNPPPSCPLWDETLEWEYDESELVFVRILIKSDDRFAANPVLAVAAVRLLYVVPGWNFIRMLDLKGRETRCSLLLKFDIEDV